MQHKFSKFIEESKNDVDDVTQKMANLSRVSVCFLYHLKI